MEASINEESVYSSANCYHRIDANLGCFVFLIDKQLISHRAYVVVGGIDFVSNSFLDFIYLLKSLICYFTSRDLGGGGKAINSMYNTTWVYKRELNESFGLQNIHRERYCSN